MPSKIDTAPNLKLATVSPAPKKAPAKPRAKPTLKAAPRPVPKMEILADDAPATHDDQDLATPAQTVDQLKLKQLVEVVAKKTDLKKKIVRDVIEATLAEISDALGQGHSLSLPSLGNLRVVKTQEKGDAKMMVLRLRVGGSGAKDDLAQDGEDD